MIGGLVVLIGKMLNMIQKTGWLAYLIAGIGVMLNGVQLWIYAHTQTSLVDEGAYLYMGYQFAAGTYQPYQDSGLWMNYAPFSYLIPGAVQLLFGPGLRAGRYFSVILAISTTVILWVLARRLGGKWWAAALVWAITLSPIPIKIYSHVISQVLVAFFLACALFFTLGEKRPLWQIAIGAVFSGVLVMTRHTMILLLPLLVAYVFWQHGKKAGWLSIAGCLFPLVIVHIIYWPNILQLWSFYWLPTQWIPFLRNYKPPLDIVLGPSTELDPRTQLMAFFFAFRAQYIYLVGILTSILLWPRRGQWKNPTRRKISIFLVVLFFALITVHGWGSLGFTSCTFCFATYISFFSPLALLLTIVSASSWNKKIYPSRQILATVVLAFVSLGIGFTTFDTLGSALLHLPVPRVSNGVRWGEWVILWNYISNKLNMDYFDSRILLSTLFSLIASTFLLGSIFLVWRFLRRNRITAGYSFGALAVVVFLVIGYVISPLMNGPYRQGGDCNVDVIRNYEALGVDLENLTSSRSQIYWAVESAVPLLYLPNINVHTAQVYGESSFLHNPNTAEVEKFGYWNTELRQQWLNNAEIIVVEEGQMSDLLGFDSDRYEMTILPPANPCVGSNRIFVFWKRP